MTASQDINVVGLAKASLSLLKSIPGLPDPASALDEAPTSPPMFGFWLVYSYFVDPDDSDTSPGGCVL